MNFGMDYVGALMSRIGGAGSVWNSYGLTGNYGLSSFLGNWLA